MTRKEDILNQPYTDRGAYRVPEGYFAELNQCIMGSITTQAAAEKQEKLAALPRLKAILSMPRTRYAAAACLAGLIAVAGTMLFNRQPSAIMAESANQSAIIIDQYSQDCMDYAMLDGDDMYRYLAEQ